MAAPPHACGDYHLSRYANMLSGDYGFIRSYYRTARLNTYGERRARIREHLWSLHGTPTSVFEGEQLRRYLDALCSIEPDPDDTTYSKYAHLPDQLERPEPFSFDFASKPQKARSIMDNNLAALLRSDARTVHVKLKAASTERTASTKTYTYVTHLPLAEGDVVAVDANGYTVLADVKKIDDEVKIEPGSSTEYKWVIGKIDFAAYEANEKRNAEIVAEAAVIVRNNMRKSFAAQVLGAASEEQRTKLLQLTGNAA